MPLFIALLKKENLRALVSKNIIPQFIIEFGVSRNNLLSRKLSKDANTLIKGE